MFNILNLRKMKKIIKTITVIAIIILLPFAGLAQDNKGPGDPDPGGPTGGEVGGGAPVGSGLVILLSLAGAYGGKKAFKLIKEEKEE